MEIDGEKAYPIWSIGLKWERDDNGKLSKEEYPKAFEGLPEGRMRNSLHRNEMMKDELSLEVVTANAIAVWKEAEKCQEGNPSDLSAKVELVRHETWCLGWFNHYTFDVGQTDREARNSFEKFVLRTEVLNKRGRYVDGLDHDIYCLMGADESWRWEGPCRCEHCKKHGLIRFGH